GKSRGNKPAVIGWGQDYLNDQLYCSHEISQRRPGARGRVADRISTGIPPGTWLRELCSAHDRWRTGHGGDLRAIPGSESGRSPPGVAALQGYGGGRAVSDDA